MICPRCVDTGLRAYAHASLPCSHFLAPPSPLLPSYPCGCRCVAQDPEARPNAKQLVEELTRLEEDAHRAAVRSSSEWGQACG